MYVFLAAELIRLIIYDEGQSHAMSNNHQCMSYKEKILQMKMYSLR